MFKISFVFNILETRRLNIDGEKLDFIYENKSCSLMPVNANNLNESTKFSILCGDFETKSKAEEFDYLVYKWLDRFSYITQTVVLIPPKHTKIIDSNSVSIDLKLSLEVAYHMSLNEDENLFLSSIVNYPESQHLVYNMFNNAMASTNDLKLLLFVTILEHISNNHVKDNKMEAQDILNYIESLKVYVENDGIGKKIKQKIIDKLIEDKKMSIRSKLNRTISMMKLNEKYLDLNVLDFVDACYSIRSKIGHEGKAIIPKKLKEHKIETIISNLQRLVGQVIDFHVASKS